MPRKARTISRTNIYHIMMRGINRQLIFEDLEDRHQFMAIVKESKEKYGFRLYAFCLMDNHIHMLIDPGEQPLEIIYKRIGSKYAVWYNQKYHRVGQFFQDRFRSENVESQGYFMTVLRYILQNPMKAGMEARPGSYRWSSYRAYAHGSGTITDTQFAIDLFGSRQNLIDFVQQTNDDDVMDENPYEWRITDEAGRKIMKRISGCASVPEFQKLDMAEKKVYVREMYLEKMTMGQISRLTGMSKSVIHKAVHEIDEQMLAERLRTKMREAVAEYDTGEEEGSIPPY